MPEQRRMHEAISALSSAFENKTSLCQPFLNVLPVTGASISMLKSPFRTEVVCASDAQAARLDELQIDLGEGPCWDAVATLQPVLIDRFDDVSHSPWPMFTAALAPDTIGALFAFPLVVGTLSIGAVDLYATQPATLNTTQIKNASLLADIAARQVLRRELSLADHDPNGERDNTQEYSRRVVHQATGMVLAQLNIPAADALLVIRGHAYAHGLTVRDVASRVVERHIDFSLPDSEAPSNADEFSTSVLSMSTTS